MRIAVPISRGLQGTDTWVDWNLSNVQIHSCSTSSRYSDRILADALSRGPTTDNFSLTLISSVPMENNHWLLVSRTKIRVKKTSWDYIWKNKKYHKGCGFSWRVPRTFFQQELRLQNILQLYLILIKMLDHPTVEQIRKNVRRDNHWDFISFLLSYMTSASVTVHSEEYFKGNKVYNN